MKGFLIFIALLMGGSMYVFTHTQELAQAAIDKMKLEEGPVDPAYYQLLGDPKAFLAKYQPFIQQREKIAKWSAWVGETQLVYALCKETYERYDGTPIGSEPEYGELIYRWALMMEEQGSGQEAYAMQKHYAELFPTGKHFTESAASMQRLVIKFNIR